MAKNESLHRAKDAKKDEFYTQYEDIQKELNHYEKHFKGKAVFCNCDDPFESNFCKFFLRNFNHLGLKRLICTSYTPSPVAWRTSSLFDRNEEPVVPGHGYVMDIREVPMKNGYGVSDDDIDALLKSKKRGVKKLAGDGDFRSEECVEYLKQADIVVTNPPFSHFREYISQLMEYGKKFLIIGNQNAITYKEIFPLIQQNKMWLGWKFGDMAFRVPDYYEARETRFWIDENGKKWRSLGTICWYTNLDHDKRHEKLVLYKKYYGNEEDYPKYDNYDAINVDKVSDIPCDYFPTDGTDEIEKYNCREGLTNIDTADDNALGSARLGSARLGSARSVSGTESWASPSLSSTSTTLNNLKLSVPQRVRERDSLADCGMRPVALPSRSSAEQDAINVYSSGEKCSGVMGVPITFLDKYNPEQFEIIGHEHDLNGNGGEGITEGQFLVKGRGKYKRILIRRKME